MSRNSEMKKQGIPHEIEEETYEVCRAIFLKYYKKSYLNRDRIVGIMFQAFIRATYPEIKEVIRKEK